METPKKKLRLSALFAPIDMTEGKPGSKIVMFAIPMLIGNIAQQLYNTFFHLTRALTLSHSVSRKKITPHSTTATIQLHQVLLTKNRQQMPSSRTIS